MMINVYERLENEEYKDKKIEIEKLEKKEDSQVITNGPSPTGLERNEDDLKVEDEDCEKDVNLKAILEVVNKIKDQNKGRIQSLTKRIKKGI